MSKIKEVVNLKHEVKFKNLMRHDVILFRKKFYYINLYNIIYINII